MVGGAPPRPPASEAEVDAAVRVQLAENPGAGPRQVAERVAAELGVARRRAYEAALRARDAPGDGA